MVVKRIVTIIYLGLSSMIGMAQNNEVHDIRQGVGKLRLNLESGAIIHHEKGKLNYTSFGYGVGCEILSNVRQYHYWSVSPSLLYNGSNEELKTYSIEHNSYYYRSTILKGRLLVGTPLYYKRSFGRQVIIGVGFQPQFVLWQNKTHHILGESASPIPDLEFRKADVSLLFALSYSIDPHYMFNIISQFGVSPLLQRVEQTRVTALRFQVSRRLK
jgi:hypothetical protein